jgi:hypothetical protein
VIGAAVKALLTWNGKNGKKGKINDSCEVKVGFLCDLKKHTLIKI